LSVNQGPIITINGFFPSVSLKPILGKVLKQIFDCESVSGGVLKQAQSIVDFMDSKNCSFPFLTFVIHNIEGKGLANDASQEALAILASSPRIHLVCSSDHINSAILWDNAKLHKFNFLWHDITNYEPYLVETTFENTIVGQEQALTSTGTLYVLRSLPTNARHIFTLLAQYQLNNSADGTAVDGKEGISLDHFFRLAREQFFVQDFVSFQTMLTEFKDHGIFKTSKGDNSELLYIDLSKETLEEVLEQMQEY
jgi:origin recognition complex subunit 2